MKQLICVLFLVSCSLKPEVEELRPYNVWQPAECLGSYDNPNDNIDCNDKGDKPMLLGIQNHGRAQYAYLVYGGKKQFGGIVYDSVFCLNYYNEKVGKHINIMMPSAMAVGHIVTGEIPVIHDGIADSLLLYDCYVNTETGLIIFPWLQR